ncbi:MAG: CDP-diacylglycerol--glycerol-3-phosphate 3-phosphatidyltransferase [Desulfatitalea sp.]|nr:CDP-alcohol phosphatidyltransferase family protein [Desulfatitalea sp.]NNK01292.1 CDP-diacylglycerol--glycerol-3-phosphate 3-phosphatidyltransferase [Desulfatitalea sp.]
MTRPVSPINIPNILTVVRILLVPVFVILLMRNLYPHALAVFILAGVSDGLDGFIARYFNQRTDLGAYLDPLADKLLLVCAYTTLAVLKIIPAWIAVLVIARDVIIIMGIAVLALTEKPYRIRPTLLSKCNTSCQIIFIVLALFDPIHIRLAHWYTAMLWLTTAMTILSGMHYIVIGMKILQAPDEID